MGSAGAALRLFPADLSCVGSHAGFEGSRFVFAISLAMGEVANAASPEKAAEKWVHSTLRGCMR